MITEAFGFPVVSADNVFGILEDLGVQAWERTTDDERLVEYVRRELSTEQFHELRFAPDTEVVSLMNPQGQPFRGFRTTGRDWATTFALLPGNLLPVVGEYKHGADEIIIVPPSGVVGGKDKSSSDPMMAAGKREWEEETGLELSAITRLNDHGYCAAGRNSTLRFHPFVGTVLEPIEKKPTRLDESEHLKMVLIPVGEWLTLIERGKGMEQCAVTVTMLALRHMGIWL